MSDTGHMELNRTTSSPTKVPSNTELGLGAAPYNTGRAEGKKVNAQMESVFRVHSVLYNDALFPVYYIEGAYAVEPPIIDRCTLRSRKSACL